MYLPEHLDVTNVHIPSDTQDTDFLAETVEEILKT
jgi:hypothetical protein